MERGEGRLRVVDLFCGAGGFSLGFYAAGFQILGAIDVDPIAAATFARNFALLQPGSAPLVLSGEGGDLERIDLEGLGTGLRPDVLVAGPPCQGFSRVGRAKLDALLPDGFHADPRNDLYLRFLDAADLWRPMAVVMENVPGMLTVRGRNVASLAAADLADRGFIVGWALLNAVWYGVPQYRERFFMIGIRKDLDVTPRMPPATHRAVLPAGYTQPLQREQLAMPFGHVEELPVDFRQARSPAVSVAEALDDLPAIDDHLDEDRHARGDFRRELKYAGPPQGGYATLMRGWPGLPAPDRVFDHVVRRTPRDYATFRRMRSGDRYPEARAIAVRCFEEEYGRLESESLAPAQGTDGYRELWDAFVPPYPEEVFPDKWRKLIPDQPSWTVPAHLAKDTYSHIHHGDQGRMISVREAARLQSFPDAYHFMGNMGDCFRQIGNAVPPLLSRAVAEELLRILQPAAHNRPRRFGIRAPPERRVSASPRVELPWEKLHQLETPQAEHVVGQVELIEQTHKAPQRAGARPVRRTSPRFPFPIQVEKVHCLH